MKKLMALMLALAMMLGCTAFAQEMADYAGFWILTSMEQDGTAIDPAMLGFSVYMELYEDGACVMVSMGEMEEGTWAVTDAGITTTDAKGEVDEYTLVEGNLVMEKEGIKLVFSPEPFTQPMTGLKVEDFNGVWEFAYLEVANGTYDAAEMGMSATLTLKDGAGHMVIADAEGTEEYDAICEIEEVEDVGTVMYFLTVDAAGEPDGSGLMLMMFTDGELVWYDYDEEYEYFNCFVRVEE